jgi:pimeloyl-ACP methyl ester carboxylesterase
VKSREFVAPPPLRYLALEARAGLEFVAALAAWPALQAAPGGDGHRVLVLPGFLADDASTALLRAFLRTRGYRASAWGLGRNLGPSSEVLQGLGARLSDLQRRAGGRKLSLVGWSLGGIYARGLARRFPDSVRQVIAIASPIRDPFSTRAYRVARQYRANRGYRGSSRVERVLRDPLAMPCTSIYSRTDGIVHWESCLLDEADHHQNVEIESSHLGMGHHPLALYVIADRLSQPEGGWTRFEWPPALRWLAANGRPGGGG